jgi:ketosteroid isomerase-like protein
MRRQLVAAAAMAGMCSISTVAQDAVPPALVAMADTEREFAKTATVKGWRDAFLDFFADDAIAFAPDVIKAKDRLRKQPSKPFSELELTWEPRTGDVASSGDLGWLTGPSTSIDHTRAEQKPGYGCYLSVWRKQPDGEWRVLIDVGAGSPSPVPFAPGFNRMPLASRYAGGGGREAAEKTLADADRELNAAIAAQGTVSAFSSRLTPASRLHRPGNVPAVGQEAIAKWLQDNAAAGSAQQTAVESSSAGDLGYSYGRFETKGSKPSSGVYVRLWSRDASGRWWLVADVAQPFSA